MSKDESKKESVKRPETWRWGMAAEGEEDVLRRMTIDTHKFDRTMLLAFEILRMIVAGLIDTDGFRMELRYDAEAEWAEFETFKLRRQAQQGEADSGQESQGNQH